MGAQKQYWLMLTTTIFASVELFKLIFFNPFQMRICDASILRFLRREAYKLYVLTSNLDN